MDNQFPSNSRHPRPEPDRVVEQVTTGEAKRGKRSLGRQFRDVFIGGDTKSVVHYVIFEVLVPQAKDMIAEAASSGFERLIFGENRPGGRRYGSRPQQGNYTNYANRYAIRGNNPVGRAERDPAGRPQASMQPHPIDEIILASRIEADAVLDRMYDLLNQYENVSVADLYSMIGWSSSHTDYKWGWTQLQNCQIRRIHDGYVLLLPRPVALD